jgi:hypothetical protein
LAETRTRPDTHSCEFAQFGAARSLQCARRIMQTRSAPIVAFVVLLAASACGPSAVAPPDASTVPRSAAGTFTAASAFDLQVLPAPAATLLAELADATDGPDDPARFLCDRLVAELPSSWQAIAAGVADDLVAPYLESELDKVAPDFASGIRTLAAGLGNLAHHISTIETLAIRPDGAATRTITGFDYGGASIDFASEGMADAIATTAVTLDTAGKLEIGTHRVVLPYGRLLRLGLDRQVIPNVDFNATDLASVLGDLVDCDRLGQLFAAKLGVGSATLYATACRTGMTALAADIYDRLAAIDAAPFELAASGTAVGVDLDRDGTMDRIDEGVWSGTSSYDGAATSLENATFSGAR